MLDVASGFATAFSDAISPKGNVSLKLATDRIGDGTLVVCVWHGSECPQAAH